MRLRDEFGVVGFYEFGVEVGAVVEAGVDGGVGFVVEEVGDAAAVAVGGLGLDHDGLGVGESCDAVRLNRVGPSLFGRQDDS